MTGSPSPRIEVRRSVDRFHTIADGLESWHSFSFGAHHDPANLSYGLLVAHNEELIAPGRGFDAHAHRDMEIVTWVLSGQLVHEDSTGHRGTVYPLLVQRMSAGRGVVHSERNGAGAAGAVHFVQMWVVPDERGLAPGYEQAELDPADLQGRLTPVVSGLAAHRGASPVRLNNAGAGLSVARLRAGDSIDVPDAPFVHLSVTTGSVRIEGLGGLLAGDSVRFDGGGGQRVTATEPAEVLVWEMLGTAAG